MADKHGGSRGEVRVKEEETPREISGGVPISPKNVKFDAAEDVSVRIKEEDVPLEIGAGGFHNPDVHPVPLHSAGCVKTEDEVSQDFQDGKPIKVEVKEEVEEIKVGSSKLPKEEDTSMEIGTDGQYTRSVARNMLEVRDDRQVLSSPLSREEKLEILKQKLLEKNRWVEVGCFPGDPRRDPNNPDHVEDIDTHRIGHTDWCSCRNCIPLPTGRESVCCQEIRKIRPHMEGIPCITGHPYFPYLCENKDFVRIHQKMMGGKHRHVPKDKDRNWALRMAAYQAFSVWIHGAPRRNGQRQIPSCTVHRVRMAFLSPDHASSCKDYPAEHMLFS